MDSHDWDARYAGEDLLWRADPNQFLVDEAGDLAPGRVLDVACGEGRNAIWLAGRGWQATGVDFSAVGLAKAARLAAERGVAVKWIEADLTEWSPPLEAFDLAELTIVKAEQVRRPVETDQGPKWALDALVRAVHP